MRELASVLVRGQELALVRLQQELAQLPWLLREPPQLPWLLRELELPLRREPELAQQAVARRELELALVARARALRRER